MALFGWAMGGPSAGCKPATLMEASAPGEALGQASSGASGAVARGSATVDSGHGSIAVPAAADYGPSECLADLERAMAAANDSNHMTPAQKGETAAAVLSAAGRHYPELPLKRVARVMIANMRQESDFQPGIVGAEREGSGSAVGLLQVSPYGSSRELAWFAAHYDANGLLDYRSLKPFDLNALVPDDLKDPWLNVHVATWIQSNLGRSGSADPTEWGKKQGPRPSTYMTGLGSWVAGPAISDSGYGMSRDDVSAPYFKYILRSLDTITDTVNGNEALSSLAVSPNVLWFRP